MSSDTSACDGRFTNSFTNGSMGLISARTALPFVFVMGTNGLPAIVDALAAVTLTIIVLSAAARFDNLAWGLIQVDGEEQ